jgi:hypothetical protein
MQQRHTLDGVWDVTTIRTAALAGVFVALCTGAPTAVADGWTCLQAGLTRQITLFYPEAPARLPCEVYYSKPSENVLPKRLWSARHEAGYCRRRAEEFVSTLEQLGWSCTVDPVDPVNGDVTGSDSDQGS